MCLAYAYHAYHVHERGWSCAQLSSACVCVCVRESECVCVCERVNRVLREGMEGGRERNEEEERE